jgi:hypothetical protein
MRTRHSDSAIAIALVALCSATVWAEDPPPRFEPEKVAAVATDASSVTPTPADVAREVVRLQEELGGSITRHLTEPQPAPPLPRPMANAPHSWRPLSESPVAVLRETAWQLDQSAHRLEMLDLYDQADALRETANSLRRDARRMKTNVSIPNIVKEQPSPMTHQKSRPE